MRLKREATLGTLLPFCSASNDFALGNDVPKTFLGQYLGLIDQVHPPITLGTMALPTILNLRSATGMQMRIFFGMVICVFILATWHLSTTKSPEPISSYSPSGLIYAHDEDGAAKSDHESNIHRDVLTDKAAAEYCRRYRLAPFDRARVAQRKIYDLLLINTELDMLELRMGQMAASVDYFIILESDRTFTDKAKPLHVLDAWKRYAAYHPQMIRRTMDLSDRYNSTWDRERASRNAMFTQVVPNLRGEQAASLDDVLLVSDADEIPKPEILCAIASFPRAPPSTQTCTTMAFSGGRATTGASRRRPCSAAWSTRCCPRTCAGAPTSITFSTAHGTARTALPPLARCRRSCRALATPR